MISLFTAANDEASIQAAQQSGSEAEEATGDEVYLKRCLNGRLLALANSALLRRGPCEDYLRIATALCFSFFLRYEGIFRHEAM